MHDVVCDGRDDGRKDLLPGQILEVVGGLSSCRHGTGGGTGGLTKGGLILAVHGGQEAGVVSLALLLCVQATPGKKKKMDIYMKTSGEE